MEILSPTPLRFQSWESKTVTGAPVYNKILFIPGWSQDVWMMNQSHEGPQAPPQEWDRLAIVVDKTKSPQTARFLQLPPGALDWDPQLLEQKQAFRVSCYLCHSNGPRGIRPATSQELGWRDWVKLEIWSLRIKLYGRIEEDPSYAQEDPFLVTPFRSRAPIDNEPFTVESCTKCHSENRGFRRGNLTRQNSMTIEFLVSQGLMPPPGFSVSEEDQLKLKAYLRGF